MTERLSLLIGVFLFCCLLAGCGRQDAASCQKAEGWLPADRFIVATGPDAVWQCKGQGTFYYADKVSKKIFFCSSSRCAAEFRHEIRPGELQKSGIDPDKAELVLYFVPRAYQ